MRVVVADDDYTVRTLISGFLEDVGYDVDVVSNPGELGDIEIYDVIIMDVMFNPERYAGIDYVLEQRANGRIGENRQVIFISHFGRRGAEIKNRLQRVGGYIWLDKPIDFPELDRVLRETARRMSG